MTLCQHGVQTDAGYECSPCVTTPPRELAALGVATAALDEVLKLLGPPPRTPALTAAQEAARTLRAYLEDLTGQLLQHEESVIFESLNTIEQYLRSEQR